MPLVLGDLSGAGHTRRFLRLHLHIRPEVWERAHVWRNLVQQRIDSMNGNDEGGTKIFLDSPGHWMIFDALKRKTWTIFQSKLMQASLAS